MRSGKDRQAMSPEARRWTVSTIVACGVLATLIGYAFHQTEASLLVLHTLMWLSEPTSLLVVGLFECMRLGLGMNVYSSLFQLSNAFGLGIVSFLYLLCGSFQFYWLRRTWKKLMV